jgi:hypothetical protein
MLRGLLQSAEEGEQEEGREGGQNGKLSAGAPISCRFFGRSPTGSMRVYRGGRGYRCYASLYAIRYGVWCPNLGGGAQIRIIVEQIFISANLYIPAIACYSAITLRTFLRRSL